MREINVTPKRKMLCFAAFLAFWSVEVFAVLNALNTAFVAGCCGVLSNAPTPQPDKNCDTDSQIDPCP